MVSSFHPHSMCKKVEKVTAKTGCTSCTNWTISFKLSWFRKKTHLLHQQFKNLVSYYNSGLFAFIMHHSKAHRQLSILSDIIWYFWCIYWFVLSYKTLKLKSISNELWKGWKLARYHHFIHIAYARKLRGLRQKLDALRVQNGQSLSKYQGFIRKLICYKGISIF